MNNKTFPMLNQLNRKQLLELHKRVEEEMKKFRVEEAAEIFIQIQSEVPEGFPTFQINPVGADGFEVVFFNADVNTFRWGYSQVKMVLTDICERTPLDSFKGIDGTWRVLF
jgi:hypothetical protein